MESLDSTTEHLRGLGDGRNIPVSADVRFLGLAQRAAEAERRRRRDALDGKASLPDELGGSSRSEEPEAELVQTLGEGQETGLVVDRKEGWQWAARSKDEEGGRRRISPGLLQRTVPRPDKTPQVKHLCLCEEDVPMGWADIFGLRKETDVEKEGWRAARAESNSVCTRTGSGAVGAA